MKREREKSAWRPSRDGPWPMVHTGGNLALGEREWLHTNGAGAYSMSTVALMHTHRYHGALVAALEPPLGRHVIVSHAETTVYVEADKRTYRLATHQFPNVAPTLGYRLIEFFALDPIPRWMFRLGQHTLERTLCLARGKNAVVMSYTWYGRAPVSIAIRPLMPLRPISSLMTEHGGMRQVVSLRPGVVELQPVSTLPPVLFSHEGVFMGSPDWWRRFEYLGDRSEGLDFHEDMWTPGTFEMTLEPGRTIHLLTAVGKLPEARPSDIVAETCEHLRRQDPGVERSPAVRVLSVAAEQFIVESNGSALVLAGYPWHNLHTRDIVLALPGLFLSRGDVVGAVAVARTLLGHQHAGLLPELLDPPGRRRSRPLPDVTLWLFEFARLLLAFREPDDPFVANELTPALVRAFVRLATRRRHIVWRSADGLIVTGQRGVALTWMDARVSDGPITPRAGIAIEHQALFTRGCDTLARLASARGLHSVAARATEAASTARASFRARFWCADSEYPYDCVSEARDRADAWSDATLRPNALIALAVDPSLFEGWQAEAILRRVKEELLTPNGVLSLSPDDGRYHGHFGGNAVEREIAYHQGTGWTHLLGFYARACRRRWGDEPAVREELVRLLEQTVDGGPLLGQLAQLCDGDAPHRPRGSPAQATAVAEVLRALVDLETERTSVLPSET